MAANKGSVLYPSHVFLVRTDKVAVRALFYVRLDGSAGFNHNVPHGAVFLLQAIAPGDIIRLAEFNHLLNPPF
jgi:hypothetical protein